MAAPHSRSKRQRDTRKTRASLRAKNPRVQAALTATREAEARLEARIKLEKAETELRLASRMERAASDADNVPAVKKDLLHERAAEASAVFQREWDREQRRERWTLGEARALYRQGYTLEHVVWYTGWDEEFFDGALTVGVATGQIESLPCGKCTLELIEVKPINDRVHCPRCGHSEAI